jgi:hypothetical protein
MSWFGGGSESVTIYSGKTGKKLCEIKAPQKWHWPIPLFPIVIYRHDVWKDPEAVKRWAWLAALAIYTQKAALGEQILKSAEESPEKRATFYISPKDFLSYPCVVCRQKTVVPVHTKWFGLIRGGSQGHACSNNDCPMKMVVIPEILVEHIDEIPMEYLPADWVDPLTGEKGMIR